MRPDEIREVAVVGAGTIGASWATLFAYRGYPVHVYDAVPAVSARALERIATNLAFLAEKGIIDEDHIQPSLRRIEVADALDAAVRDVDFVQESVAEDYEVKKSVFRQMDRVAPAHAILASSSSGLLISEIQRVTARPGRCVLAHPFNPPHLIPLVEIVRGEQTDRATIETTHDWMVDLGKIPVVLRQEVPGHIANRLQAAVWREAIDLVDKGVASVEDVDKALYAGPGLRWALMGPHMIFHLGGGPEGLGHFIDTIGRGAFYPLWEDLATWTSLSEDVKAELVKGVEQEQGDTKWEEMATWRDNLLVELLEVIYS